MTARFSAVGLVVSDMGRALAFYRLVGLDIPADADELQGGHRVGLAFECESPSDVDAVFGTLVGAGHETHLEPWDAFWGQRYASVHDPDGNSVELFAPLE